MKFSMIDMTNPKCWVYIIPKHLTKNRKKVRFVSLGKRCIKILKKYIGVRRANQFIFRPVKNQNSCYSKDSYRQSVKRSCKKAGVPIWSPIQLRKRGLTDIAKRFGEKVAAAVASHGDSAVTRNHYIDQLEMAQSATIKMDSTKRKVKPK